MAKDELGREYIDCEDGVRRYTGLIPEDRFPGSASRKLGIVAGLAALLFGCQPDKKDVLEAVTGLREVRVVDHFYVPQVGIKNCPLNLGDHYLVEGFLPEEVDSATRRAITKEVLCDDAKSGRYCKTIRITFPPVLSESQ